MQSGLDRYGEGGGLNIRSDPGMLSDVHATLEGVVV